MRRHILPRAHASVQTRSYPVSTRAHPVVWPCRSPQVCSHACTHARGHMDQARSHSTAIHASCWRSHNVFIIHLAHCRCRAVCGWERKRNDNDACQDDAFDDVHKETTHSLSLTVSICAVLASGRLRVVGIKCARATCEKSSRAWLARRVLFAPSNPPRMSAYKFVCFLLLNECASSHGLQPGVQHCFTEQFRAQQRSQ